MRIFDMMADRVVEPVGFAFKPLRLSWKVDQTQGKTQAAAQVVVGACPCLENPLFDSGKRQDIDSLCFVPELQLSPRTRYYWKVTVWADNGDIAEGKSFFETGKMDEAWTGKWITSDAGDCKNLLKTIALDKPVKSARAYATAMGVYELYVGETKIGDEYLTPYYNDYSSWNQVTTFDLTGSLKEGENTVRFMLGGGWAASRFGLGHKDPNAHPGIYANHTSLLAEIHVEFTDGTTLVIGTDETWTSIQSKVRASSIYDGEVYDATFDTSETYPVRVDSAYDYSKVEDRLSVPLRITERIKPVELIHTPKDELVIDLGQEITGWLEFRCAAPKGTVIKLSYSEILQNGCFYRENLRSAKAEYTYVSDGVERVVRPFHTFYGFRLVKVEGLETIDLNDFTGCVVHSDIARTGYVETSNPKVNRFALNALWGQRGNFLDVPTDCPQRDERLGWTGDAQAFSGTACFNMHSAAFFQKYLHDMLFEQNKHNGSVPHVVPACGMDGDEGSCAWADVATIVPWNLYMFYGDKELLKETYPNMKEWVDWIKATDEKNHCGRLWNVGFHFADWLALDTKNNSVMGGTDPYFVASAYYYYSTSLLVKAAHALGYAEDEKKYSQLLDEIYEAIQNEYFTPNGLMAQTTQTAYVCALFMGFAPEAHRAKLAKMLDAEIAATDGKLRTGFVGTAYLNRTLSDNGYNKRAYKLMMNEEYPGWLYEVNMGATTVWERWNSVLPNGMISDTGMNSLNHYAYGAVMEWVYRNVAGINPVEDAPGFRKALIKPQPDYLLPKVSVRYNSAMGWYESSWEIKKDLFTWDVEVPFGAEATLVFPEGDKEAIQKAHPELDVKVCEKGFVYAVATAGKYHFEYKPVHPLHRVISLDLPMSEALAIPEVKAVLEEELPMLRHFAGGPHSGSDASLRSMLTMRNPMFSFPQELVDRIEKRLLALN